MTWMASCVPAVCQQNDEWRGERPIISHMHTLLSRLSQPKPWPCEIRQTDSAKTITPPYTCMWSPPAHTHTYLSGMQGVIFPSLSLVLHTHMHRRPERLHGILYVSLRLTHRTKQVIRAWVKSSIHIVLSVCSQSASLFHSGRTPLTAGRIWAISKNDLLALPDDLRPASAYACNSLWHFISSLVTVFIVYYHNINNNDKAIIKSEAI